MCSCAAAQYLRLLWTAGRRAIGCEAEADLLAETASEQHRSCGNRLPHLVHCYSNDALSGRTCGRLPLCPAVADLSNKGVTRSACSERRRQNTKYKDETMAGLECERSQRRCSSGEALSENLTPLTPRSQSRNYALILGNCFLLKEIFSPHAFPSSPRLPVCPASARPLPCNWQPSFTGVLLRLNVSEC